MREVGSTGPESGRADSGGHGPTGTEGDEGLVDVAVELFAMLADPTRVRMVLALAGGELSVNTLAVQVGKQPAAVSQHLAKLRLARIVSTRQQGTRVFYRLANEHVRQLVADAMFQAEHTVTDRPRHHQRPDQGGQGR